MIDSYASARRPDEHELSDRATFGVRLNGRDDLGTDATRVA
jgi:hypothetical protein